SRLRSSSKLCGRPPAAKSVRAGWLFSHPRTSDLKEFDRFYNCRVEFGDPRARWTSLTKRSACRSSPPTDTCWKRFVPIAKKPRRPVERRQAPCAHRLKTKLAHIANSVER